MFLTLLSIQLGVAIVEKLSALARMMTGLGGVVCSIRCSYLLGIHGTWSLGVGILSSIGLYTNIFTLLLASLTSNKDDTLHHEQIILNIQGRMDFGKWLLPKYSLLRFGGKLLKKLQHPSNQLYKKLSYSLSDKPQNFFVAINTSQNKKMEFWTKYILQCGSGVILVVVCFQQNYR